MGNKILPNFKPGATVSNGIKGTGKILITINEEAKAFVAWADGSRSWVRVVDVAALPAVEDHNAYYGYLSDYNPSG